MEGPPTRMIHSVFGWMAKALGAARQTSAKNNNKKRRIIGGIRGSTIYANSGPAQLLRLCRQTCSSQLMQTAADPPSPAPPVRRAPDLPKFAVPEPRHSGCLEPTPRPAED